MNRDDNRREKEWLQRQKLGLSHRNGNYIRQRPRRVAAIEVKCAKCGALVAVFERRFDFGSKMTVKAVFVMYEAGPAADPLARVAFACIPCDNPDILVNWAKMESMTADLLDVCRSDDTPRSVVMKA